MPAVATKELCLKGRLRTARQKSSLDIVTGFGNSVKVCMCLWGPLSCAAELRPAVFALAMYVQLETENDSEYGRAAVVDEPT